MRGPLHPLSSPAVAARRRGTGAGMEIGETDETPGTRHPVELSAAANVPHIPGQEAESSASPSLLRPGWPLSVLFLGFPIWWVTGFSSIIFLIMAVPMALHLLRRRPLVVPRGFGLWLLFLVWVAAGVAVLWVHAPGTVEEGGLGRLIVYGYRSAWYVALTIVLLYVGNLSRQELPARRLVRLLGFMFVVTTAGGLLGVFAPELEFRSLLERALPAALAENGFVNTLIHPVAADIQSFLGYEEARPVAPFAFANSWGANYSMYLPFFILAWFGRGAGWRRYLAPFVLLGSVWPVIHSLNRGLWVALGIVAVYVACRLAASGHKWAVQGLLAGGLAAAVVLLASPLQDLIVDRVATPHSNERRYNLSVVSVMTTLEGSPILGFGSTREVGGNFNSIAIGDAPDCPDCSAPPLGTQGHLWMVIFSQGFAGAALYFSFLAVRVRRHWRDRSPYAIAGCCALLFYALYLPIYDMLEAPLFTVMIALGLMWRHESALVEDDTTESMVTESAPK